MNSLALLYIETLLRTLKIYILVHSLSTKTPLCLLIGYLKPAFDDDSQRLNDEFQSNVEMLNTNIEESSDRSTQLSVDHPLISSA